MADSLLCDMQLDSSALAPFLEQLSLASASLWRLRSLGDLALGHFEHLDFLGPCWSAGFQLKFRLATMMELGLQTLGHSGEFSFWTSHTITLTNHCQLIVVEVQIQCQLGSAKFW